MAMAKSISEHLWEISVLEEEPLWTPSDKSKTFFRLGMGEYRRQFPVESSLWFPSPVESGIVTEATKNTGEVLMNPLTLLRNLMHPVSWKNMFPGIIVNAVVPGDPLAPPDTNSQHIEISAEIQLLYSPLAAVRKLVFGRTCYRMKDESWLVVDLPMTFCRQLPYIRICLIRPSRVEGLSNVVWTEMTQFRLGEVHPLCQSLTGGVFGSERWFRTLSRECRRLVSHGQLFSPVLSTSHPDSATTAQERRRLVKLAKEMTARFYSGLSSATPRSAIEPNADQRVSFAMEGPYWTAAKSAFIDAPASQLFVSVRFLYAVGNTDLHISFCEKKDCCSLHTGSLDGKKVVQETFFDDSGAILVTAGYDNVSSVITSVFGLSIHSHSRGGSILTIAYVQPPSYSPQIWKKDVAMKIQAKFQDIILRALV